MNILENILNEEGISKAELCRASGVNATTISTICKNKGKHITREVTKTKLVKAINKIIKSEKYTTNSIFKG